MTSTESEKLLKGDCEDFAILLMRRLIEKGIYWKRVFVCLINRHAFCGLFVDDSYRDFFVLDNGYLSYIEIKASRLFPIKKDNLLLNPLYGFNYTSEWRYKNG